ncbi:hypothetical protein C2G38_2231934 [Gigaspora rosea]|uniref:Uncharacterized protein n=1 Tax=Gigaspora rosea TaxID=44941 RepID=A0A397U111_9GLOM|nr:hypothetical protein C2G38_2231934 [Gigaspora rosea]
MNRAINIKTFSPDRQPCIQDEMGFDQYETKDGAYRSIRSILTILLPIWKQSTLPVLIPGDTIKFKLGGDGHNPNNQYCICLYAGYEKYEVLTNIGYIFKDELSDLKNNGFFDSDGHNIRLILTGHKIEYMILKQKLVEIDIRGTGINFFSENRITGKKPPLFPAID